jgi:CheY-like chemotaxis protein
LVRAIPSLTRSGPNHRLTILCAEREVVARNIIRVFLQRNYAVLFAANGDEALALSREYLGTIDILLSDLEMAGRGDGSLQSVIGAERPGIRVLRIRDASPESAAGSEAAQLRRPFQLALLHDKLSELSARSTGTDAVSKTVLVIDGNASRRERIKAMLTGNYAVLSANSSAEADAIRAQIPGIDLVIDSESISRLPHPITPAALLSLLGMLLEDIN